MITPVNALQSNGPAAGSVSVPLHQSFIRIAKQKRDKIAVQDISTGRELSFGRLLIASLILARRFRREPDGYLGIMVPTSAGCVIAVLASLMLGKVPVMINYSTGAADNIEFARRRCGFRRVITSRKLLERIGCPELEDMEYLEDLLATVRPGEKILAALQAALPSAMLGRTIHRGHEDDTAVILFTSGSEKAPKGVELSHRNLASNAAAASTAIAVRDDDVFLCVLPLFHVFGQMTNLWLPLNRGLTLVTYGNPLDFKTVAQVIRDYRPTILIATPYFLAGYAKPAQRGDLASLRLVIAGADKAPESLRSIWRDMHGIEVLEGYGATETSPVISVNTPEANRPGSVGRPLPGVQLRIVDIHSGEDLPAGREGKILVKGELIMKGYFDDIEETTLHIENGWYETGDMGCIDEDGFLWHRGRLKRFVKIGGEMVSLVRVEEELERLLPPETECCVVEIPDARKGANIAAAVTGEVDRKKLLDKLTRRLPPIAIPRQFVVMDELPKMGSGKIDFRRTTVLVQHRLAV
jgi:acyl-[acyl-carrier-protein]-phospholipid O-acyltransferase/long-chain-fatty-acid--[acyl-carrier-protein] ligase